MRLLGWLHGPPMNGHRQKSAFGGWCRGPRDRAGRGSTGCSAKGLPSGLIAWAATSACLTEGIAGARSTDRLTHHQAWTQNSHYGIRDGWARITAAAELVTDRHESLHRVHRAVVGISERIGEQRPGLWAG